LTKNTVEYFHFRYTATIIGMIIVLAVYLIGFSKEKTEFYSVKGKLIMFFKYFVIINVWIFAISEISYLFNSELKLLKSINEYFDFYQYIKMVTYGVASIFIAYLVKYIPYLKDKVTNVLVLLMYLYADLMFIILTCSYSFTIDKIGNLYYVVIGIMFVINIFSIINIRQNIIKLIQTRRQNLEAYPVLLSAYLLFIINKILTIQFDLGHINFLFSFLYILTAFGLIIFGFIKKYVLTRRFGLALTAFATGKLFIYDLSYLETGWKIISYISYGIVLLVISYMYQKYSKQIERFSTGSAFREDTKEEKLK
jgi:uncharacterized membrane protein